MSFSTETKNALTKLKSENFETGFAELYGFIFAGASLVVAGRGAYKLRLKASGAAIASRIYTLIKDVFGFAADITYSDTNSFGKRREYSITVSEPSDSTEIMHNYALIEPGGAVSFSRQIKTSLFHSYEERYAFLRGVFLSAGFISDPAKTFSLEFYFESEQSAAEFNQYLSELGLNTKIRTVKNAIIVYMHAAEDISSVLAMCKANKQALDIQSRIAAKDMKNRTNRIINFETANLNKTIEAAYMQKEAIERIIRIKGLSYLSDVLIEAAQLRLDNLEASLSELADMAKVSRSTFDKRMRKIIDISGKLK